MIRFLILLSTLLPIMVSADVSVTQRQEVDHLLAFIGNSGCMLNRNGADYLAEKGLRHIKKKYDYFRDDIKDTEDFIALAATKSTMSGDYYKVKCPGKEVITTQDWLLSELKKYREK